ncbi:MAG: UxaA family hydrolase [Desulfatiglandaceae bacterium]
MGFSSMIASPNRARFKGIMGQNGRVGTRNYIGVLPTASCPVSMARWIAEAFPQKAIQRFRNVDGVVALGHGAGCCAGPDNEGFLMLQRVMHGIPIFPEFCWWDWAARGIMSMASGTLRA